MAGWLSGHDVSSPPGLGQQLAGSAITQCTHPLDPHLAFGGGQPLNLRWVRWGAVGGSDCSGSGK